MYIILLATRSKVDDVFYSFKYFVAFSVYHPSFSLLTIQDQRSKPDHTLLAKDKRAK